MTLWFPNRSPRFSLMTLLAGVLLAGSSTLLWMHWNPWRKQLVIPGNHSWTYAAARKLPLLAVILDDTELSVWNWNTKTKIFTRDFRQFIHAMTFSPSADCIAISTATEDTGTSAIHICSLPSGNEQRVIQTRSPVSELRFTPDGKRLVGDYTVWSAESGEELLDLYAPTVNGGLILPDDEAKMREASSARIAKARTMNDLKKFADAVREEPVTVIYSNDARFCATRMDSVAAVQIWDLQTSARVSEFNFDSALTPLLLAPGARSVVASKGSHPEVWSVVSSGAQLLHRGARCSEFQFSSDGTIISDEMAVLGELKIINLNSSTIVPISIPNLEKSALSPDGGHVAAITFVDSGKTNSAIVNTRDGTQTRLPLESGFNLFFVSFVRHDMLIGTDADTGWVIYRQHRPDGLWGIAVLPEFWCSVVFLTAFVISLFGTERGFVRRNDRFNSETQPLSLY
jgi:hypothetical protein